MRSRISGPFLRDPDDNATPALRSITDIAAKIAVVEGFRWATDNFYLPSVTHVLTYTPLLSSLMCFRNGILITDWTLLGTTITLGTALAGGTMGELVATSDGTGFSGCVGFQVADPLGSGLTKSGQVYIVDSELEGAVPQLFYYTNTGSNNGLDDGCYGLVPAIPAGWDNTLNIYAANGDSLTVRYQY
jgi:hypothetical protein